jgi:hypothetical protein
VNFKQQLSQYVIGNLAAAQLPEVALQGIREGLDCESIWILAGMNQSDPGVDKERYLEATLRELNLVLPERRTAALMVAVEIAESILEGRREIIDGVRSIVYDVLYKYDFDAEKSQYAYGSIGFEKVYGNYWSCDEIAGADRQWREDKTNEELMEIAKAELMYSLREWKEQMTSKLHAI